MTTDNPAGRLYAILEKGNEIPKHLNTRETWYKILDVDNGRDALLMSRIGKVMELSEQIITDMQTYFPRQVNSHQHWSSAVNQAFSEMNLNESWKSFISHIDDHTMTYLSMAVDMLDTKENIKNLSLDDLKKVRNKIDKILQDIIKLDIDESFKKDIVKYLRKILTAIDEYSITGIVPIMESIESTLGHAFIDENYKNNLMDTDIGKQVRLTLGLAADMITVSLGLPQLTTIAQPFLLSE